MRRARAATLLTLALPGSAYLYQGEELGLPEVADLPADALQDPTFLRSGGDAEGPRRLPRAAAVVGATVRRSASATSWRTCRSPPTSVASPSSARSPTRRRP